MTKGNQKNGTLRNQKGLTLIELLAVIVIIGILSAIAVPSISGLINKTKEEAHRANAQIIIDAAKMKIAAEDFAGGTITNNIKTLDIYVAQLVQEGYLEKVPEDPQNKGNVYTSTYSVPAGGSTPTGSGSKVTAQKDITTGSITYSITLIGNRDGGSSVTYLNNVKEDDLKEAKIN